MSHELRTPLNAIIGYIELLATGVRGPLSPMQQEYLDRVRRSSQHLLGLINDVLNFARVEAGRLPFHFEAVPVADVLAGLRDLVEPQLTAKQLHFEIRLPGASLRVHADAERLHQILLNLLSNATKFTPEGGHIWVNAAEQDDAVRISVGDDGRGIAEDKLRSIFEPFVQVPRQLAKVDEGVGLGLTISRELARAMGGDLLVESSEHRGSVFTLVLPAAR